MQERYAEAMDTSSPHYYGRNVGPDESSDEEDTDEEQEELHQQQSVFIERARRCRRVDGSLLPPRIFDPTVRDWSLIETLKQHTNSYLLQPEHPHFQAYYIAARNKWRLAHHHYHHHLRKNRDRGIFTFDINAYNQEPNVPKLRTHLIHEMDGGNEKVLSVHRFSGVPSPAGQPMSPQRVWTTFETFSLAVYAQSRDRRQAYNDRQELMDLRRQEDPSAVDSDEEANYEDDDESTSHSIMPPFKMDKRRALIPDTERFLNVVPDQQVCHWVPCHSILHEKIERYAPRAKVNVCYDRTMPYSVLKLLLTGACCLALAAPASAIAPGPDSLWATCEKQQDTAYFYEEAQSGCYQGLLTQGIGDPCKTVLQALRITEQQRDRQAAEASRLSQQVDTLSSTIEDTEHEADLDDLRRQIAAIKQSALLRQQLEQEIRENVLPEPPGGPLHPTPPTSSAPPRRGISAAAGVSIFGGIVAVIGLVLAGIRAYHSSNSNRDRTVHFVRDPAVHASTRDLVSSLPNNRAGNLARSAADSILPATASSVTVNVTGGKEAPTARLDPRASPPVVRHFRD